MNVRKLIRPVVSAVLAAGLLFGGAAALGASKASAATPKSLELLSFGKQYIGTPYLYGAASGLTSAFDCSSFVQYIFGKEGTTLPRTAAAMAGKGTKVAKASLSVGDLVFFSSSNKMIGHVAIYAGSGNILHASTSQGVTVSSMNSAYWKARYVTAKRIL
ncbi:C40 family peptidase [Cohnella rhizosphaerae]|uniref:C40 family peptidase n=1 Tax=Cohnella rhizosphaerae TaxID=1457232 RepID=A0A9X4KTK6_9BACL|nr:C40 family peptidase [Cohnella rhizosphaerae]MDG0807967.1 C40 family peptidase [Cohnella rhizosphaerae]